MDINIERIGVTLIVKPKGEIDHHIATGLRDKIDKEIYENKTFTEICVTISVERRGNKLCTDNTREYRV